MTAAWLDMEKVETVSASGVGLVAVSSEEW